MRFTWWTYWVAIRRAERFAKKSKSDWACGDLDVWTCCEFIYIFEKIKKRTLDRGYMRLANRDVHDWKPVRLY